MERYQSIYSYDRMLQGIINRGGNTRLITLFHHLRNGDYVSHIADYPLIAHCLILLGKAGRKVTRQQISRTMQITDLSKESKFSKIKLIDQLQAVYKSVL